MKSPFAHSYGKSPLAPPKVVTQSPSQRTASTIALRADGINIPTQKDADRRASFSRAAI